MNVPSCPPVERTKPGRGPVTGSVPVVAKTSMSILVASDAAWVHDEVLSAAPAVSTVRALTSGRDVLAAVAQEAPSLVVLDSQIGSMGAMAVTYDLRNEQSGGRLAHVPVLLLLDRQADVFLAKRCAAEGWLVKPLDPLRLRRALATLIGGGRYVDRVQHGDAANNFRSTADSSAR